MRRRDKTVLLWFVVILVVLVTLLIFQVADLLILRRAMAKMTAEIRTEADVIRTIEDVHAIHHGRPAPSATTQQTSGGIFGAIGRFIKGIFFKQSASKA